MAENLLTDGALKRRHDLWRRVFSLSGIVLIAALIDLVAFFPRSSEKMLCYTLASASIMACIYSAKKLKDVERVHATADGAYLLDAHVEHDFPDGDQ
jgi:hypothetical protein